MKEAFRVMKKQGKAWAKKPQMKAELIKQEEHGGGCLKEIHRKKDREKQWKLGQKQLKDGDAVHRGCG